MKPGLVQVHVGSLIDFMEKRQVHPIEALHLLALASGTILAGYVEHDMSSEEKTELGMQVEQFSERLREVIQLNGSDLFAVLLCTQVLNRELIESAILELELAAKEAAKKNADPAPVS